MSEAMDYETGEIRPNGNAARAQAAAMPMPPPTNRSLNDALELALREIPIWITATQSSGRGNAKYATLKEILEVVRPALAKHRVRKIGRAHV